MDKISIDEKFALFSEPWRPKLAARLNGQEGKLVKVQRVFPWDRHEEADEMFLVRRGRFRDSTVPGTKGKSIKEERSLFALRPPALC